MCSTRWRQAAVPSPPQISAALVGGYRSRILNLACMVKMVVLPTECMPHSMRVYAGSFTSVLPRYLRYVEPYY